MSKYTQTSIETLYGSDDDFILIGVTGRTGSGCSTAAQILNTERNNLKHSFFTGKNPNTNQQRSEKIIFNCFKHSWEPFLLISVRSIITLQLAKALDLNTKVDVKILEKVDILKELKKEQKKEIFKKLKEIQKKKDETDGLISKLIEESNNNDTGRFYGKVRDFYNKFLPEKSKDIKNILGSDFTKVFQELGNNIRLSGNPIVRKHEKSKFFTLAEEINKTIKQIRNVDKKLKKPTFVVIDAIRNPLEAFFFQDRYAAFYLLAITCDDDERKQRLRKLNINDNIINQIDNKEYESHNKDETYTTQDIPACLQRADLYINNQDATDEISKFTNLTNQLIKFVMLMRHPGIITPTPLERCMQIAYTAKLNSGCISRQVGATITDSNFSVKAIGWNDVPEGQVSCNLRSRFDLINGKDTNAFSTFERNNIPFIKHIEEGNRKYINLVNTRRNLSFCFKSELNSLKGDKNQVHTRALHAEENAFLQLSKYGGNGIQHGFLFTTASPCELCAKKAYQLGIKRIYYIDPYPGIATPHILQGGHSNPELLLFTGAIGRAFHKLYSPLLPYKDELKALLEDDQ